MGEMNARKVFCGWFNKLFLCKKGIADRNAE